MSYPTPSEGTFEKKLKTMSDDIKKRKVTIGNLFLSKGLVKPYVVAITDSELLKSNDNLWYVSIVIKIIW